MSDTLYILHEIKNKLADYSETYKSSLVGFQYKDPIRDASRDAGKVEGLHASIGIIDEIIKELKGGDLHFK